MNCSIGCFYLFCPRPSENCPCRNCLVKTVCSEVCSKRKNMINSEKTTMLLHQIVKNKKRKVKLFLDKRDN
jgi:hypothetical protein